MKKLLVLFLVFEYVGSHAQTGSEIYVFDLKVKKGEVMISNAKNITNHVGYDNQPHFHSEEPLLYYSSFNEDGRADIKSYNFKTTETKNITNTLEREYSPTLTPDKSYLSCIIQRENGAQDLGKYSTEGGEAVVLLDSLLIGYHAWADNNHLALFVLGKESAPNTLHYIQLPTKKDTVLATNIGRSLHKVPRETAISFVHKASEKNWQIKKLNTETLITSTIGSTLPGREDITWTPDGILLSSDGTRLFQLTEGSWKEIILKADASLLKGVTRLAVSGSGKKLAVVVSE
jgi:hypothetical protein